MNRRRINKRFANLQSKIQKFNENIRNGNGLNFYKVVDYTVQFAEINSCLKDYYNEIGYPDTLVNSNDLEDPVVYISYFITSYDQESQSCWKKVMKMWQLNGIFEKNGICQLEEIKEFFRTLNDVAFYGTYTIPKNPDLVDFKRQLLCKIMNLAFTIWVDKEDTQTEYLKKDGREMLKELKNDYNDYQICMGSTVTILNYDGCNGVWKGPEFGLQIEQILTSAEEYYQNPNVYTLGM